MSAPLYGLVLAGGRSSRMGQDKAVLRYYGRTQLEQAVDLAGARVARTFLSVRRDQVDDPERARFPHIVDQAENLGPVAGILAAATRFPDVAWLVLACDLPFLDEASLDHLIEHRAPARLATAYRSSHDGLPEPLCAIWEPASREPLRRYVEAGRHCPRKFLILSDVELLEQPNPRALDNVNTPEEYGSVMSEIGRDGARNGNRPGLTDHPQRVRVQYFALLREQAGRSDETVETTAATPRDLYEELRRRHPFTLGPSLLRVAVNSDFGDWNQRLREGDTVVFIPPVAGG